LPSPNSGVPPHGPAEVCSRPYRGLFRFADGGLTPRFCVVTSSRVPPFPWRCGGVSTKGN
jgi:hypothetical protein